MQIPPLYELQETWTFDERVPGWVVARPWNARSLFWRLSAAWEVLTGRAGIVRWK